jgi:hypothetical protein
MKQKIYIMIAADGLRILFGKPEGKRPLGRPRRRWDNNNKIGLREMGWGGRD